MKPGQLADIRKFAVELYEEAAGLGYLPWLVGLSMALALGWMVPLSLKLSLAGIAAIIILVLSALQPVRALYVVFLFLISEGAIRKWILPGAQDMIYFGKDLFLAGIYLGLLIRNQDGEKRILALPRYVQLILVAVCAYMVIEFFNPRNPSLVLSGFGLRNYVFYMGLIFAVPQLFQGRGELYTFLKVQILLAAPVCILGFVQYFSGPDHWLNAYANAHHAMDVAKFGGPGVERARITGPFSYITGFTAWLTVMILVVIPFFLVSGNKDRMLFAVPLSLLLGNLLMTGSRGPLLMLICSVPIFVQGTIIGFRDGEEGELVRRRMYTRLAIGTVILGIMLATVFRDPLEGVLQRTRVFGDESSRIGNLIGGPLEQVPDAGVFGWGMGTTHQARNVLMSKAGDWGDLPAMTEEEPIRIMQELGLAGFLLWYLMRVILIFWVIHRFRIEKDAFFKLILLVVLLVQLTSLPVSMVLNHTLLLLFWFFVGVVRVPMRYTGSEVENVRKWRASG